jgi:hypothetical protein
MHVPDHEEIENVSAEEAPRASRREWIGLAVQCCVWSVCWR